MASQPSSLAKGAVRQQPHLVAVGKHHQRVGMDLAVLEPRHAVVHAARQLADFRDQRAAERDVHLLQPAADAEQRHTALDAGLDQRQRHRIAFLVVGLMRGTGLDAEIGRMDVGTAAGQQDAVDRAQQRIDVGDVRDTGEHQRQGLRHFSHGAHVPLADDLHVVPIVHDMGVPDHADHRFCLACHSLSPKVPVAQQLSSFRAKGKENRLHGSHRKNYALVGGVRVRDAATRAARRSSRTSSTRVTGGVPSRPEGSTTVMPRVRPGASDTPTDARNALVTMAGSTTTAAAEGIDQEEAVTLALAHVPAAIVLDQGSDEGLVVAIGRGLEHAVDVAAFEEMADARLPGNDRGVEPGAKHDGRRFGIAEDVELGGRRDVAAAVQRAAHDGEPPDAGHDARRTPQRQREVGERADHQQIDRIGPRQPPPTGWR